jgi:8-oxo-dGTP pyrophosphatase MutT (NUDIX family)
MHRQALLNKLRNYRPYDQHEREMHEMLISFVESHSNCFERSLKIGHITGSAWIVDRARTRALLTHHRKLDRWLQLGGHADGDADVLRVALREAREESGLEDIRPLSEEIFDVDVHPIPARGAEPRHFHYDVRFLLEADAVVPLVISRESKNLAWVAFGDITRITAEPSIGRMVSKSLAWKKWQRTGDNGAFT